MEEHGITAPLLSSQSSNQVVLTLSDEDSDRPSAQSCTGNDNPQFPHPYRSNSNETVVESNNPFRFIGCEDLYVSSPTTVNPFLNDTPNVDGLYEWLKIVVCLPISLVCLVIFGLSMLIGYVATKLALEEWKDKKNPPTSDVKGLRFGGQFIVKSFTIRRATPLELLRLLSFPPASKPKDHKLPFPSTTAFLPTNFTILAHQAWRTLTLGLGTNKSKVLLFVFDSQPLKAAVDRSWPSEIPLGNVNNRLIRGLAGAEMARFKFRKGCITFYVYAVRRVGAFGFSASDDLRTILQSVVELKDFLDHTAMLAMPNQRTIRYQNDAVAMAH
ncbi:uncharacterized protein G2W53_027751 [Senna tora]|uniref:DUF7851 domain-containing protein n=1 Tax=Senna tora TaxID=362788 RepID=A0A834TK59_9FABA|nr:uncharacterized protein G2W53_027751 [Senna tora]